MPTLDSEVGETKFVIFSLERDHVVLAAVLPRVLNGRTRTIAMQTDRTYSDAEHNDEDEPPFATYTRSLAPTNALYVAATQVNVGGIKGQGILTENQHLGFQHPSRRQISNQHEALGKSA